MIFQYGFDQELKPLCAYCSCFRYLANGVWDLQSVTVRSRTLWYSCCPNNFSEVVYRLTFRRRAQFYVIHLIIPSTLLSTLSLLVFYLPPDCGEKLTLAITNLLALVVFQQVMAEHMPPSGDDSPIIGMLLVT